MDHEYINHVSMGIAGLSIGILGLQNILLTDYGVSATLLTVGGLGVFLHAGLFLYQGSTTGTDQGKSSVFAFIGAVLCLLGMLLFVF